MAMGEKTAWSIAVSSSTQGIAFGQGGGGHGLKGAGGPGVDAQDAVLATEMEVLAEESTTAAVAVTGHSLAMSSKLLCVIYIFVTARGGDLCCARHWGRCKETVVSENVQMSPPWGRIRGEAGDPISPARICKSVAESAWGGVLGDTRATF